MGLCLFADRIGIVGNNVGVGGGGGGGVEVQPKSDKTSGESIMMSLS